ncbi:phosphatase PAP2 family protein [Mesorhizobium sp. YM1C-6-2]|uniref:phosphatase PAP2 family protein n=1 Tax=Mesorhizobium sp. YM1C-6-2 TaxID=1827501 RepID=UPI000EF223F8|nr:phosphatase PAP2 family protein [Mesorhizobium sp. YM1C-6-2]RLP22275.1 phosphatase PAP2 family protein [Mesorhizobium sp. YM1C-6-2]
MDIRSGIVTVALCTVAFMFADAILLLGSNVQIAPQNWLELAKVAVGVAFLWSVTWLVDRRLAGDPSRIALLIKRASASIRLMLVAVTVFVPMTFATTLFMFLASATSAPLTDAYLAEMDRVMGFDWIAFHQAMSGPITSPVLIFAYHALGPQVPLVLLYHSVMLKRRRIIEFLVLLAVAGVPTAIGMYLFPAAGAYSFYQIDPGQFSAHAGMWHYDLLLRLRAGEPFEYLVTHPAGLTTFPSFHTALGLLIIYSLRHAPKVILLPVAAVNAAMIVSTLPEGGHYLIDVIAGVVVAAFAITFARFAAPAPMNEEMPLPAA